jgi:hypothetical protein
VIRDELALVVLCDDCGTLLPGAAGEPARFADRLAAIAAIDTATSGGGWARRLDGRLLCGGCANESLCLLDGHDFRDRTRRSVDGGFIEDGSFGWRWCACDRSIPSHADAPADPAGGEGCGMVWRLCGRCDHIEELHVTDAPDLRWYPNDTVISASAGLGGVSV